MSTHSCYGDMIRKDIRHIYSGQNSITQRLPNLCGTSQFNSRLLVRMLHIHPKPDNAFKWNMSKSPISVTTSAGWNGLGTSSAPAFRRMERPQVNEIVCRLRTPTASSKSRNAIGRDDVDKKPNSARRGMSVEDYNAMLLRLANTHTHASKMSAEHDVNRLIKDINSNIPSDSIYCRTRTSNK